jgi:hypothetical protein
LLWNLKERNKHNPRGKLVKPEKVNWWGLMIDYEGIWSYGIITWYLNHCVTKYLIKCSISFFLNKYFFFWKI